MIDFSCEFEYEQFGSLLDLYTDNSVYFGEIAKHANINPDGSGTVDFSAGSDIYLPQKAEELGYKQAHIEAFIGMKCLNFSYDDCSKYLDINSKQIGQLVGLDTIIKFRIFPTSTIIAVKEKAAEHFKIGYECACDEIKERMKDQNTFNEVRMYGVNEVVSEIKKTLPDNLFAEYCELYKGVV